jgi:aldehyde:ferredoxin oxidoreductase
MTGKMALRDGFGDIIADGSKVAAERIGKGSDKYAMHVGGQEFGAHDPR